MIDFKLGSEFSCGGSRWRVTDIGTRVIVAIRVEPVEVKVGNVVRVYNRAAAEHEGWFNGPPYALAEHVFDEDAQKVCGI